MTKLNICHCTPEMLLETVEGDKTIFLEFTEIFFRDGDKIIDQLKSAATAGDLEKLGFFSHSLKNVVGPLGAEALLLMLQNLEDECMRKQFSGDPARIATIDNELNMVKAEMQHFIAHL